MNNKNIYKAAIIGCGRMGSEFDDDELEAQTYGIRSHAGGYTDNPNTELIALYCFHKKILLIYKQNHLYMKINFYHNHFS